MTLMSLGTVAHLKKSKQPNTHKHTDNTQHTRTQRYRHRHLTLERRNFSSSGAVSGRDTIGMRRATVETTGRGSTWRSSDARTRGGVLDLLVAMHMEVHIGTHPQHTHLCFSLYLFLSFPFAISLCLCLIPPPPLGKARTFGYSSPPRQMMHTTSLSERPVTQYTSCLCFCKS